MSKERARRRAEEKARRRAPKTSSASGGGQTANGSGGSGSAGKPRADRKARQRSAREQRSRRRLIAVAVAWAIANGVIWLLTDSWSARWIGLTVTTILVPVVVWLVWDPEGRVDL